LCVAGAVGCGRPANGSTLLLSVIIPTLNSENVLTPTLASLVSGAAAGTVRDVIIADGGSTDGTAEVADIAGCEFFAEPGPLARRLRMAARQARAPWLMFLKPGVVLDPSWVDDCGRFIRQAELRGFALTRAATFRRSSEFDGGSLVREALALVRMALRGTPAADQGLIVTRRLYEQIGGHSDSAKDPEADLIAQLGRRRIVVLRSGAAMAAPVG